MARYIDIERDSFPTFHQKELNDYMKGWNACLKSVLQQTPTSDVVGVKHGYWKDRFGDKYDNHLYECSVCGKQALYKLSKNELGTTILEQALTLGCPHCLAKMYGGAK